MPKPTTSGFFAKEASRSYDEKNRQLSPIMDNMHFLIRLALRNHAARAHVLCIGVGTGAEILSLSNAFPEWTFVGVDPSAAMLEVCRERLADAGVLDRCELIEGYVDDVPLGENFDGVLSILVAHFVKHEDKTGFFTVFARMVFSSIQKSVLI
jgi:tRNA (cmo5U34)-methyltransferase